MAFFKNLFRKKKTKSSNGGMSQNDNLYTAILSTKSENRAAESLMDCLQRSGEVIVDGKRDVLPQFSSGDGKANAEEFLRYFQQGKVTAVLMLNSKELASFLDGSNSVRLQITGESVDLDASVIAHAFRANELVRSKLLVVILPSKYATVHDVLGGVDTVMLQSDKSKWNKEIVGRFMEKISVRGYTR